MKKIIFIALLFPIILLSQEKYKRKSFYKFSDNIEFRVVGLINTPIIDVGTTGLGQTVGEKAKKGFRYVFLWLKIKNNSDEKKLIDLTKFEVVDENSNVYKLYLYGGNGLNMSSFDKDHGFKIKTKKSRQARIYFKPQIPKNSTIKLIRVNGVDRVEF